MDDPSYVSRLEISGATETERLSWQWVRDDSFSVGDAQVTCGSFRFEDLGRFLAPISYREGENHNEREEQEVFFRSNECCFVLRPGILHLGGGRKQQ